MVPSLKFTLIAWVAFIGLGSLSFVLKDKKDANPIHPSNTAKGSAIIRSFTTKVCFSCPPDDKLITCGPRESKNPSAYILSNQIDYWNRKGWDKFGSTAYGMIESK